MEYECVTVVLKLSEQEAVQITSECEGTVTNTDVLKYQGNGIIVLGEHPLDIQTEKDGLQQVVKGYTATLWQTQDPSLIFLFPTCKLL